MKNMVINGAIVFRSPSRMQTCAMTNVSTIARRGSLSRPLPAPKTAAQRKDVVAGEGLQDARGSHHAAQRRGQAWPRRRRR